MFFSISIGIMMFALICFAVGCAVWHVKCHGFKGSKGVIIEIIVELIVALALVGALWYGTVSPNAKKDTLVEVVSEVSEEYSLGYADGSRYSKDTTSYELVSYADGKYKVYLYSADGKKLTSRFIDAAQILEPVFNEDATPKLETVVITNYYADADNGEKKLFPITETKYRFVLPSEEFWHE